MDIKLTPCLYSRRKLRIQSNTRWLITATFLKIYCSFYVWFVIKGIDYDIVLVHKRCCCWDKSLGLKRTNGISTTCKTTTWALIWKDSTDICTYSFNYFAIAESVALSIFICVHAFHFFRFYSRKRKKNSSNKHN